MMPSLRPVLTLFLVLFSLIVFGCNSTDSPGGAGGLPEGSYLIKTDSDDFYLYEQYYVVRPNGIFEFVEYGYRPGEKSVLCQLTRFKATYSITDTTLTLRDAGVGESLEDCGIDQKTFNAYSFRPPTDLTPTNFPIRNITATSFEVKGLDEGSSSWKTYLKTSDPYGFY
jgi:hypothetical protein